MRSFLENGTSKLLIFIMTCVFFVMTCTSASNASTMAKPKKLTGTLQDAALLFFLVANCKDAFFIAMTGVEGYLFVSEEYASSAAEILMPFVAVDRLTLAALVGFILFFFDENRKRVSSFGC
jgi:hypothetical protein